MQGSEDSLGRLIWDLEQAAADGTCAYWNEDNRYNCKVCPADLKDLECSKATYGDIARRLHALMPHDAKGTEIKPGDTIKNEAGMRIDVADVVPLPVLVIDDDGTSLVARGLPHLWRVVEPDSWERLQEDAAKSVCEYAGAPRSIVDADKYSCINCPYDEPGPHTDKGCHERMRLDLVRRAKRLAGVEQ